MTSWSSKFFFQWFQIKFAYFKYYFKKLMVSFTDPTLNHILVFLGCIYNMDDFIISLTVLLMMCKRGWRLALQAFLPFYLVLTGIVVIVDC